MILSQSSQIAVKAIAHVSSNGNSCVNVKELAEKWKDQIDPKVYEALMNYEVEITD